MIMSPSSQRPDDFLELRKLFSALCEETISCDQFQQLEKRLSEDVQARAYFARYMQLQVFLEHKFAAVPPSNENPDLVVVPKETSSPNEVLPISLSGILANAYQGTIGFFSQEMPFALLIATVITGLGLLAGSLIYVTHHRQIAAEVSPSEAAAPSNRKALSSDIEFVGRVTGMVGVKWSDVNTSTELGNGVPLRRRYDLASGLMEITYNTGAKVILQGPVTYAVDSRDGGYLSIGKLTARLEKSGAKEVAGGQWPEKVASGRWSVASKERSGGREQGADPANQKSEIRNQKSPAPRPQSPAPTFAVRTPTATVTDLGTEFGVEVSKEGNTISHVFHGFVEVQPSVRDGQPSETIQLCENQSVLVEKQTNGERLTMRRITIDPTAFVNAEQLLKLMAERKLTPLRQWQARSKKLRCDSSLVAYYTFEQHSLSLATLPNQSKLGRLLDGQIENAEWVDGRIPGKPALYFHGPGSSSRVVIPHNDCFNFTGPFSVAVCFRSVRFSGYWQALIGKGENSWRLMQNMNGHNLTFDTDRYADGPAGPHTLVVVGQTVGNTTVDDNRWHWAVAVYEPMGNIAKKRLYIDGRIDVENESALPRRLNNEPVYLGTINTKSGPEFQGMIDEVAIFSRALSADEIAVMFQISDQFNLLKKKRGM